MKHRKIYVTTTCKCNNSCKSCCITDAIKSKYRLSFEEIKNFLSQLTISNEDIIEISGGEATLHEDFWKIAEYLKGLKPMELALLTNAEEFVNEESALRLGRLADHVVTTIYSTEEDVHDYITSSRGSFKRKIRGLQNLNETRIKLHLKTIPLIPTYKNIPTFIDFCLDNFNSPHLIINMLDIVGTAMKNAENLAVSNVEIIPYVEEATEKADMRGASLSLFMPMCLVDPCYWDHFPVGFGDIIEESFFISPTRGLGKVQTQLLRKPEECKDCILDRRCYWPWENYFKVFSKNEIRPINDRKEKAT